MLIKKEGFFIIPLPSCESILEKTDNYFSPSSKIFICFYFILIAYLKSIKNN